MSERKSWDVQPKRAAGTPRAGAAGPAPAPVPRAPRAASDVVRLPKAQPQTRQPQRNAGGVRPAASARGTRQPAARAQAPGRSLAERRRGRRRGVQYAALGIAAALIALFMYGAWAPALRITRVEASGPGAAAAQHATEGALSGRYAYVLPRNSVFLLPIVHIRVAVLNAVPEASAVSISRTSFTSLAVLTTPRAAAFLWCGISIDTPRPDGCYTADSDGLIFAMAPEESDSNARTASNSDAAASSTPANALPTASAHSQVHVFGALSVEVPDTASPIDARVVSPGPLPDALKFVDTLRELGAPVTALGIRGDEADLWLGGPTRIIYVLGRERDAAVLAASALPTLNLKDGSIQYVDLRFPGKAYVKRYGE